jgi:hypothetical protein
VKTRRLLVRHRISSGRRVVANIEYLPLCDGQKLCPREINKQRAPVEEPDDSNHRCSSETVIEVGTRRVTHITVTYR